MAPRGRDNLLGSGDIKMRLKHSTSLVAAFALAQAACTTIGEHTAISTTLHASELNSIGSVYMERPTFVSLQTYSDGRTALVIEMDAYESRGPLAANVQSDHSIRLDPAQIDRYLPMIDKYFEWADLATSRGDIIDREIGRAPGAGANMAGEIRFSLHSGNAASQLLVVEFCAAGACINPTFFTRSNATILKQLLQDVKAGKVQHLNADEIYK